MNWVYINSEPGLWTTGFYDPNGKWNGDDYFPSSALAAERVHYLNGGTTKPTEDPTKPLKMMFEMG